MNPLNLILSLVLAVATAAADEPDAEFASRWTPLEGTQPAHWRVVWTSDPAREATVSWTTAEPGTRHRVLYDAGPAGADFAHSQPAHRSGAYTRHAKDVSPPAYYHHARLVRLTPSTTYRFALESDGVRSRELSFTTAPADDRPFAILVGGDSRTGWRERCFVNGTMARVIAEDADVLAFSHGGDYVMYGVRWDEWSRWLHHHELTTAPGGRVLPIVPTRGNHDGGHLFDEVFDDPGGAERNYYRTRLSPSVSLVTLNSNISVAGDQLTWMESELKAARADSRWVLTSYHRPLYPAVKTPSQAKPFWAPVFERHGVDLALESDGHCIKRTVPIRADAPHPDGVVYVGEGGLGVPQRDPRTDDWYLQPPGMVTSGHHVLRVDFAPDRLRARFLRLPSLPGPNEPHFFRLVIPPASRWRYLPGDDAPAGWTAPEFDASAWPIGEAGFGYGDDDDRTVLPQMYRGYETVFVRHTFDGSAVEGFERLTLMCRYDDAFIAYLNGVEVARAEITGPEGARGRVKVNAHEAREVEAFRLEDWRALVRPGNNVLALAGYNRMRSDRDFTLDPWLAGGRVEDPTQSGLVPEVIDDTSLAPRGR